MARIHYLWLMLLAVTALSACSGGSGSDTVQNVDTSQPDTTATVEYTGPAPATADVQNFKLNIWDNLVGDSRCGGCHQSDQAPLFVRADDINVAYSAANSLVDLPNPANSRLVTKVAGGHNCWLDSASVCGDIITNYVEAWAGSSGSAANVVTLTAPQIKGVGQSRSFPVNTSDFDSVLTPMISTSPDKSLRGLLQTYCAGCHADDAATPQQPYFASSDIDIAYEAAKSKINLDDPANSRLVLRLSNEFHNCWSDCGDNADDMEAAIAAYAATIPLSVVDPALVLSKALNLEDDGIVASSGGRVETNVIALYEFKTGSGVTAYDTSGVDPALNLNLIGDVEWVGSWGIRINDGKAQGSTTSSTKLHNLITATNEYTIEAWVVPDNVTQDGPARIVSYSGGNDVRNFTLGQTLYNYNFLNRSSVTDANGQPDLSTADADERLQATLQHVVLTYDPVNGRRIYVNGVYTGDADSVAGGTLADWDDSFALVLGDEVSSDNLWRGTIRLLAIHNRALGSDDIQQNYDAGVGEKFLLLFSVSHLISVPDSYIVFEVQQFDNYGYLFNAPFFTSLDADVSSGSAAVGSIDLRGLRIGINGRETGVGQAFANLDTALTDAAYIGGRQPLSSLGTVIELEKGPGGDEFFLTFDQLGANSYVRTEPIPATPPEAADIPDQSLIGLRRFEEINATLAAITGGGITDPGVRETYDKVRQQLPTVENIDGFLAAHQMGVTQLAVEYCSSLVGELGDADTSARDTFFPGFNFAATPDVAFDTAGRAAIIDPLISGLLAQDLPVDAPDYPAAAPLAGQPLPADISAELNALVDRMASFCPGSCAAEPDRTINVVKATCAAAIGSAVMLIQ